MIGRDRGGPWLVRGVTATHGSEWHRLMRTFRLILGLVLALAAIPAPAQAQNPQQRIDAAKRLAETRGLPVTLLDSKVAEGRAKGVPLDRIAVAVERRVESLTRARDAMLAAPRTAPVTHGDLSVGADAIEAGVDPAVLGRLTTAAPANQRAVAISVLTQLVANGESSDRALARVTALLRDPEALRRLPGEADAARGNNGVGQGGRANPGRGNSAGGRGRGQGGPPASVPGPAERPKGRENNPGKGRP